MRSIAVVVALFILGVATFGVSIIHALPESAAYAMECSEKYAPSDPGHYDIPNPYGQNQELTLNLTKDDYEHSMNRSVMRCGTIMVPSANLMIEPDNEYVKSIGKQILEMTEGKSDREKATVALRFVQEEISYLSDEQLYGCTEFWAYPTETLYLHKGDCEDKSILLCSILLSMGYDSVLLDYPGHIAVGVRFGGDNALPEGSYFYCETTIPSDIGQGASNDMIPAIVKPGDVGLIPELINNGVAEYRNLIQRIFKI